MDSSTKDLLRALEKKVVKYLEWTRFVACVGVPVEVLEAGLKAEGSTMHCIR
jgi:hypothetical protein